MWAILHTYLKLSKGTMGWWIQKPTAEHVEMKEREYSSKDRMPSEIQKAYG